MERSICARRAELMLGDGPTLHGRGVARVVGLSTAKFIFVDRLYQESPLCFVADFRAFRFPSVNNLRNVTSPRLLVPLYAACPFLVPRGTFVRCLGLALVALFATHVAAPFFSSEQP